MEGFTGREADIRPKLLKGIMQWIRLNVFGYAPSAAIHLRKDLPTISARGAVKPTGCAMSVVLPPSPDHHPISVRNAVGRAISQIEPAMCLRWEHPIYLM